MLELLVLKNAAECTSQRLKRTSGARVMIRPRIGRGWDADGMRMGRGWEADGTRLGRGWDADGTRIVKKETIY